MKNVNHKFFKKILMFINKKKNLYDFFVLNLPLLYIRNFNLPSNHINLNFN